MQLRQGLATVFALVLAACASHDGTYENEDATSVQQAFAADGACAMPDPTFSPGKLCSQGDSRFDGFRYSEHVAHCARHVTSSEKGIIAAHYGVAKKDYGKYEFDHRIPLGVGGTNDMHNVWPQPLEQALEKDKLEAEMFQAMQAGTITQAEAVQRLLDWRPAGCTVGASPRTFDPAAMRTPARAGGSEGRLRDESGDESGDEDGDDEGSEDAADEGRDAPEFER